MANEVNRAFASGSTIYDGDAAVGADNLVVKNLLGMNQLGQVGATPSSFDFGSTAYTNTTQDQGVAPTVSVNGLELTCAVSGAGSSKSHRNRGNITYTAGHRYFLMCRVKSFTGTLDSKFLNVDTTSGNNTFINAKNFAGDGAAPAAGETYAIIFDVDVANSDAMKIGLGIGPGTQAAAATIEFDFYALIDGGLSSGYSTDPDAQIVPYITANADIYPTVSASTWDKTTGKVTVVAGAAQSVPDRSVILAMGDSFATGNNDVADGSDQDEYLPSLAELRGNTIVLANAIAGRSMTDQVTPSADFYALDGYTLEGTQPTVYWIQSSNNGSEDATVSATNLGTMIDNCVTAGAALDQIYIGDKPPNLSSNPYEAERLLYNSTNIVSTMASKGVPAANLVRFSTILEASVDSNQLKPEYQIDGVNVHPNSAGHLALAQGINAVLSASPTLTTPYADLINMDGDVVAGVDLNTNITGDTSLVVTWYPAIPNGLSESGGVVSGTVTTPTGTTTCTVTGTNSFGSVSDSFQWTTLTTGAASNINTTINSTLT